MTRNLKALGLALAAVFAMSAIAASTASAQTSLTNGHITSDGPVTLFGKQTAGAPLLANSLTAYGDAIVCPTSTYTGHKLKSTPHQRIASGETTATITPHYTGCKVNSNGLTAHVDMNGCDYEFTTGVTTPAGAAGTYGVTAHIRCPTPTTHIRVTVTFFGVACTTTIAEQTVSGAHLTNLAGGKVRLEGAFTGVKSSRSGFGCSSESEEGGVLHSDVTIEGRNAANETTQVSISD